MHVCLLGYHASYIIDRNLKTDYQILIVFGMNISDTTGHQMAVQVSTSPNVCFCATWENRTSEKCIEMKTRLQ